LAPENITEIERKANNNPMVSFVQLNNTACTYSNIIYSARITDLSANSAWRHNMDPILLSIINSMHDLQNHSSNLCSLYICI
jgi:hypothetical protein